MSAITSRIFPSGGLSSFRRPTEEKPFPMSEFINVTTETFLSGLGGRTWLAHCAMHKQNLDFKPFNIRFQNFPTYSRCFQALELYTIEFMIHISIKYDMFRLSQKQRHGKSPSATGQNHDQSLRGAYQHVCFQLTMSRLFPRRLSRAGTQFSG